MRYVARNLQRTGSAHELCQDRCRVFCDGNRIILSAADGHGNTAYSRSAQGAFFAANAAVEVLQNETAGADVPAAIKDRYDQQVANHLRYLPLDPQELMRLGNRPQTAAYGTTLLAVRVGADGTDVFQMGDGEIYLFGPDGTLLPELPKDEHCKGNFTSSLSYPRGKALRCFRHLHIPRIATAVMMFTDGCEGGLEKACAGLMEPEKLDACLEEMVSATDHGDDQTCLLVFDADAVAEDTFRKGLVKTLEGIREAARRERRLRRACEEFLQLQEYLTKAVNKAGRMRPHEASAFLRTLQPDMDRYEQLAAFLGSQEVPGT